MSVSPNVKQMLEVAKGCDLQTLDEAYANYMSHYDCFFLISDYANQKAAFHKQLVDYGLTDNILGGERLKKISIDAALLMIDKKGELDTEHCNINTLNVSPKIVNILYSANIRLITQLTQYSHIELLRFPDMEEADVVQINDELTKINLTLKADLIDFQTLLPNEYEEALKSWDDIRAMLLLERIEGTLPRECFENIIDHVFELGYNFGKKDSK